MQIIAALFVFGILILFHELGHFFAAKKMGVQVERFSIGLGPPIIKFKRAETEYTISAIPFGGYVKMAGENFEERKGEEGEFTSKTPLQRTTIVLAGPGMSFILPLLIFYFIFITGFPTLTTKVGEVMENYPAKETGIKKGDIIISINNRDVEDWEEMSEIIRKSYGRRVTLKVKRGSEILTFHITPKLERVKDIFGEEQKIGLIGVRPASEFGRKKFDPFTALIKSTQQLGKITYMTLKALYGLFTGKISPKEMGGPLLIAGMAGEQAKAGLRSLLIFTAIISVNLGVINLIPLPVLDGGHILFLLLEGIRGKPVNEKVQKIAQQVAIFLLIGIMFFVTYNDLIKITRKTLPPRETKEHHEEK
ncbi:MAG TPA: RIP metalloprotease RseP [Candidatus Omnitrophica bacterium]|nr:RIP metalloprotease RseP [Candidatus Omnitrophota bacterium]